MRALRDALQDLVEQEFDPVHRAAPLNGHDLTVLTRMKHGEIALCMRHACLINPEDVENSEEIRSWGRQITATQTVTYAIIDRCFSDSPIETWIDLEDVNYIFHGLYMEKFLLKALERLVKITHHKLYKLDLVMESDGKGKYRLTKRKAINKSRAKLKLCEKVDANGWDIDDDIEGEAGIGEGSADEVLEEAKGCVAKLKDDGKTFVSLGDQLFAYSPLSRGDQRRMLVRAKCSDPEISRIATNELIKRNFRLVVWCANKFRVRQGDAIFWDVIQEGLRGLERTIKKIELRRAEFSTYAYWWITAYIRRFLERDRHMVGIPYWEMELLASIKKAMREAESEGKSLSIGDIMEMTGRSIKDVKRILGIDDIREFSTSDTIQDESGDYVPANHDLERIILSEGLSDLGCNEAEMNVAIRFESKNFMEVLRIVKGMIKNRFSTNRSNLSREDMDDRDLYMFLRRLDLYDMPWADVTNSDIAYECGCDKQRVDQVVKDTIRPLIKKAMHKLGFSAEKIEAYKELLDLWMMRNENMSEGKKKAAKSKAAVVVEPIVADSPTVNQEAVESFESAAVA
ncbi:MAG: RNA polymerase, sigma 70 subunit, RpoD subfamily protein [Candidatus Peregrinibacteria bacterium GW2011_GWC2_39_14]|nr:MAG: RNA polymerase, sigma 70 subunit, RpoD subfamily protein [Candidatus Peregrinibacteria bacterium GW2011_GWA2_38_36]KKR06566.1 MAG: RNA polymerase, sigma 70 subunit, RpoD subfamily protein [Candidatus Peregrinibacteria bacterium GW2011_GWC2_39_14]